MADVFEMKFTKVFPLLISKAERKGRTIDEVYAVTEWLTSYTKEQLESMLASEITYGDFLSNAPKMNPERFSIKGSICGIKIQEIEDPRMKDLRILDKLIDDLAKGKPIERIIPQTANTKNTEDVKQTVLRFTAEIKQNEDMDAAYVEVPYDIRALYGKGRLLVNATFNGVSYSGQVVRMGTPCYIIGVTKQIRKEIGKSFGDVIEVTLKER